MRESNYHEEFTVRSWAELQEKLFHDSWSPYLNRFRSSYVYRGLSRKDYDLSTTLNRLAEAHLEKHLLRNFIKYAHRQFQNENFWNFLALAQHHGLPTRLLDWTYSPLVALHFATANFNSFDHDGMIWAVNYVDSRNCLPNSLAQVIEAEGSHIFTTEMLLRKASSLSELDRLKAEPFALFLEPPSLDDRIVNQYAVFSMMSQPEVLLNNWLPANEIRSFKIIIPAELKWEIRDKLDQSNINERVLFPGFEGLAKWLRRQYVDIRNPDNKEPYQG